MGVEDLQPGRSRPAPDGGIQAAVLAAAAAGRASGGGRPFLTGLWLAAVSTLAEAGERDDVMALLLDRACALPGYGRNADAPPLVEDDRARERRATEAAQAARVIADALSLLPAAQDEDFPERFLDVAVALLAEAWGPVHVRRALWDQRAAIEDGSPHVILPVEPAVSNGAARPRPQARDEPQAASAPAEAPPARQPPPAAAYPAAPLPPRTAPGRRIEAHVDAALAGDGSCVYAACARIRSGDVHETRELTGTARGASLRGAAIRALADLLGGSVPGPGEHVRVSTPIEGAVRLAECGGDGGEEGLAAELANIACGRAVEWRLGAGGMGSDLARRCDRALRDRIDEEVRASAA